MIAATNLTYFWDQLVTPRLASAVHRPDAYVWGGSFSADDINQGTDCSGAVSAELSAMVRGPGCIYQRQFYTGTFAGAQPGDHGPWGGVDDTAGLICIAHWSDAPADAAMIIAVRQMADPTDSHTICRVQGIDIEMGGGPDNYHTSQTDSRCASIEDTDEFNQWFYLPGPIEGQPPAPTPAVIAPSDTLWADVSEYQVPLDDSYFAASYVAGNGVSANYSVISLRSNDGDHQDGHFAQNYATAVAAANAGQCKIIIVYYYWRPGETGLQTHMNMVNAAGGPHPAMVSMIDLESGGNPAGDQSSALDDEYNQLQTWLGNPKRVIGYANLSDERTMWQVKPDQVPFILAGYGANPQDPGVYKIAHQYTDGTGYGDGLPEGAPPFGNCDMNSADGLSPDGLASALGIATGEDDWMSAVNTDRLNEAIDKILGGGTMPPDWSSRAMWADSSNGVDDTVGMLLNVDGNTWNVVVVLGCLFGLDEDVARVQRAADNQFPAGTYVAGNDWLRTRTVKFAKAVLAFKANMDAAMAAKPAAPVVAPKKPPKKGT